MRFVRKWLYRLTGWYPITVDGKRKWLRSVERLPEQLREYQATHWMLMPEPPSGGA